MLFDLDPVEAIRLRVAAVTAKQRFAAMARACPRPAPLQGLQAAIWGDPVPVGAKTRQKATTKRVDQPTVPSAASVFTLAALGGLPVRMRRGGSTQPEARRPGRLVHGDGVAKYRGTSYGAAREPTEEEIERERARRARQKPPRPAKGARTRSRKLMDLIGGDENG